MENATKALLIAAAILVAIIIISLGLAVVRQGQEAVSGADLSEAEMEAFNAKFKPYEGTNVSTADVNALLSAVFSHNQTTTDGNYVTVKSSDSVIILNSSATSIGDAKKTGSSRYTVTLNYKNGIVESITVN